MIRFVLGAFVTAFALGLATAASASVSPWVSLDGVGGVVPGMTAAQVHAAWGIAVPAKPRPCVVKRFRAGRLRGYALFLRGRFGAVFFSRGAVTTSGIRIGSSLSALRAAYGKQLRPADPKRTAYVRRPGARPWQLRFDLDRSGRVRGIAFGDGSVHFVGGCGY